MEGRHPNIFVSYKAAKAVGNKATYVRQKGLDEEVCMQLILSTLKLEPAKKADLFAVLKGALPDVMTEAQKSKKLSNLLQKMKKARIIDVKGIAANSEWHLLTKDQSEDNLVKKSQGFSQRKFDFSQGGKEQL